MKDIFGGLFLDDVDDVVNRNHSYQFVLVIDHRNGQQVVQGHLVGYLFLIRVRGCGNHVAGHDLLEWSAG